MKALLLSLFVFSGVAFSACEQTVDATFSPQLVIEGYLYANEPLDSIVVRRTIEITQGDSIAYVEGAIVTLTSPEKEYRLIEQRNAPGRYHPQEPVMILPGVTYKLRVEGMGQVATSETTVPEAIHLDSAKIDQRPLSITGLDTVDYPATRDELVKPGVRLWWSKSATASGYGMEAVTFDSTAEIIDFDPNDLNVPDSTSMGRYRFFILSQSEQIVWRQFRRYGENTVRALALDRNLQDFALGLFISQSQFDNNTLHIDGGLGVFGSAARASMRVFIRKTLK
jgi:hypothetical protein